MPRALRYSRSVRELNRRDFVRAIGMGAAAAWIGCGDSASTRDVAAAILEPTSDRLMIVVWARQGSEAFAEIRDATGVTTLPIVLAAGSGAIDLAGLSPATTYEITIRVGTSRVGPHVVRTAPADDDPRPVRLAVFADVDVSPEFDSDLVDHIVAAAPDLLVSLGDFPYTDNGPVAETIDAYRARHAETRSLPRVRHLLEAAPLRAIYDDHEFRNNWDAAFAASEASRFEAAMTAWDEFFPVRDDHRYRNWRWGANAECFLLDTRRHRSGNAMPDGPDKTMLGAEQRAWFLAAIARSTAPFKLVFTSVPLGYGDGDDTWESFATERDIILDAMLGLSGVIFFAADQHWFAAHEHAHRIREFQFGPLARGPASFGTNPPGVIFRESRFNAGLVDISPDGLTVTALGVGGERFYEETLTIADLTPR